MRYLVALIAAATLAGCATQNFPSHIQDYRPKGQDAPIAIQGLIQADPKFASVEYRFLARMDNVTRIALNLGSTGNGETSCKADASNEICSAPDNHAIGASCMSSSNNGRVTRINCTVFVDNERAATFSF